VVSRRTHQPFSIEVAKNDANNNNNNNHNFKEEVVIGATKQDGKSSLPIANQQSNYPLSTPFVLACQKNLV
jgi:hypothetical protein